MEAERSIGIAGGFCPRNIRGKYQEVPSLSGTCLFDDSGDSVGGL